MRVRRSFLNIAVMRTLFFALLATNLAVWGWSSWFAPGPQRLGSTAPKLPQIKLASEVPPVPKAPRCVAIGPFLSPEEVSKAGRMLEESGYQPSVRTGKGDVTTGYVVMATGFESTAAQARTLRRLRLAGFADAASSDSTAGLAVSVGSFRMLATARARAAAARRAGVATSVLEQTRRDTVFWLEFGLKAGSAATPESLQSSLQGDGNALKVDTCEPAAA